MVDILEIVSSEATKVAATAVIGGVDKAASHLFKVLKRKCGSLAENPDELRRLVLSFAHKDADWADELVQAVSALNSDRLPASAPRGIEFFRNHARHLADPRR